MDELYGIAIIKATIYDSEDHEFYLLCNSRKDQFGFYVVKFQADDPNNYGFLTKWSHKLLIGDANINISRGIDRNNKNIVFKELCISYKTDNINTYNIVLLDLIGADLTKTKCKLEKEKQQQMELSILLKFECFQIWESTIFGLLLSKTKDFVCFSRYGVNIIALGSENKRLIDDSEGHTRIIHSCESLSFLKVDPLNYLSFQFQDYDNRVISVEQEWIQKGGNQDTQNQYDDLFKIKVHEITLRELLILQSIYVTQTTSQINELIGMQPDPRFFYKSFLELDGCNMVSILSFDSMNIAKLLDESHSHLFSE